MKTTVQRPARRIAAAWWMAAVASLTPPASSAAPGDTGAIASPDRAPVEALARAIVDELAHACPLADAASQSAFDACRRALFADSRTRRALAPHVLWGRQARDPATPLKDTKLTQFAPEVHAGLYLPLFMFDGTSELRWVESEKLYRLRLGAAFRNRLPPGQFPYPFWHEAAKWDAYENANAVLLWIAPPGPSNRDASQIRVAQFTWQDGPLAAAPTRHVTPSKFDGQWLWTDATGRTQPAATLFDGLYSERNPYKAELETRYRALAISLRESQCFDCHVPTNPNGLKRLVLLQTPAHAAGEIERILKSVREDRMPRDETGIESPLPAAQKETLLTLGAAFERSVVQAREWEEAQRK